MPTLSNIINIEAGTYRIPVHADPGHAWAEVPLSLLRALDIQDKISNCSYTRGSSAYLEEDSDLAVLRRALDAAGVDYAFDEDHTDQDSEIRGYPPYIPTPASAADLADTAIGNNIIELLGLRVDRASGRVETSWGTKTPMGLARTMRRIMAGEGV